MLLEIFATTENMFMEVARNVICAIETAAESAEVGHLMDCPGPIGKYIKAPGLADSICRPDLLLSGFLSDSDDVRFDEFFVSE